MQLDDAVPRPDHTTRQARRIAAEPSAVWNALRGVRLVRPGSSAVRWEALTAVELRATGRLP